MAAFSADHPREVASEKCSQRMALVILCSSVLDNVLRPIVILCNSFTYSKYSDHAAGRRYFHSLVGWTAQPPRSPASACPQISLIRHDSLLRLKWSLGTSHQSLSRWALKKSSVLDS